MESGRQLKKLVHTNGAMIENTYNADGLRVAKKLTSTSGNVSTTKYSYHGKNLVHLVKGSQYMHFWYDAQNRPAIVNYSGTKYAYIYNLQGDVLGLIDSTGEEVVRYTYDAWGKVLSTTGALASTLGALNPFRYRGYIYDTESQLYYLRSRFYSPNWQRFLNADSIIMGNLFAYCKNSPIAFSDADGTKPTDNHSQMPASFLVENAIMMYEERWMYGAKGDKREGFVDCIGVILYCVIEYFGMWVTKKGPDKYKIKINNKMVKIGQGSDSALTYNVVGGKRQLHMNRIPTSDIDIENTLLPGMVLYTDFGHVGVYIGYYYEEENKTYHHAVIHSPDIGQKVTINEVTDTSFKYYAEYNYIKYNMSYNDTLLQ